MKIVSTEPFQGHCIKSADPTVVVLRDSELPVSLGPEIEEALFVLSLSELPSFLGRLILINAAEEEASFLTKELVQQGFEYWADAQHLHEIRAWIKNTDAVDIYGIVTDERWVKLLLGRPSNQGRLSDDFLLGLQISKLLNGRSNLSSSTTVGENTISEPNLRTVLIKTIIPVVKPLKQYLPARLVAFLYKSLEKLR